MRIHVNLVCGAYLRTIVSRTLADVYLLSPCYVSLVVLGTRLASINALYNFELVLPMAVHSWYVLVVILCHVWRSACAVQF